MNLLTMGTIQNKLKEKKIKILNHAINGMKKRGYHSQDIVSAINNGDITKKQILYGQVRYVIESFDVDYNPIVLVVTEDREMPDYIAIITVFPPIQNKFIRCIGKVSGRRDELCLAL